MRKPNIQSVAALLTATIRTRADAPHRASSTKSRLPPTDRRRDAELPIAATSVAGRGWGEFRESSHVPKRAQTTHGRLMPRARDSLLGERRILAFDNAAHGCAPVEVEAFPGCLRRRTHFNRTPRLTTATKGHRSHELPARTATPQEPFITCHAERNIVTHKPNAEPNRQLTNSSAQHVYMNVWNPSLCSMMDGLTDSPSRNSGAETEPRIRRKEGEP